MATYRITYIAGKLDANANPPAIVAVLFPGAQPTTCSVSEEEYLVTFAEPQVPVALSPLIKVEPIS